MDTQFLIDNRNKELWESLNKTHDCSISFVNHTNEYGCFTKGKTAVIYVPESNKQPDSFTHELLHIFLKQKEVFIGGGLKRSIASSNTLNNIYSEALLDHMGNCFDHIKMLPLYLELGFSRESFLLDFEQDKCKESEIKALKKKFKIGLSYNSKAIDFFIGKIFAIKACPNEKIDYELKLEKLKMINKSLFEINNNVIENWKKVDIEDDDIMAYNYNDVIIEYTNEMEEWAKNRRIK